MIYYFDKWGVAWMGCYETDPGAVKVGFDSFVCPADPSGLTPAAGVFTWLGGDGNYWRFADWADDA